MAEQNKNKRLILGVAACVVLIVVIYLYTGSTETVAQRPVIRPPQTAAVDEAEEGAENPALNTGEGIDEGSSSRLAGTGQDAAEVGAAETDESPAATKKPTKRPTRKKKQPQGTQEEEEVVEEKAARPPPAKKF